MFKFNNGNGAILCDGCSTILISPASEGDYCNAPLWSRSGGQAFCNLECHGAYSDTHSATPTQLWDFMQTPPDLVRYSDEDEMLSPFLVDGIESMETEE